MPAPASPLMISVRFAPAAASSTARSAMEISRSRPISGLSRCGNTSCAASSRSRSADASGPGARPSSCRSARSRRSNWRSAACRSPLAACRRIRARWARSSPGSSSATASHRPSRRSRSRWLWLSCSRRVSAHSSYLSAGSSSPPYSASASRAAAASPVASARRASSPNWTASTVTLPPGYRTTWSPRSTTESGTPMARRAKCAALCSFGTASAIVSPGQTRSMTCSRCNRRPGASASTFTTAAAWRRFQPASATGTPPTVTANRPSSVTWISGISVPRRRGSVRSACAP